MNGFARNLPSPIRENSFDRNYYIPNVIMESPESVLARENAVGYLKVLKEKIRTDHLENMTRIISNHEEIMKGMQYQAANNYISGLNSEDRLKISSIEAKPYVWESTLFGFQRKSEGITIKINR